MVAVVGDINVVQPTVSVYSELGIGVPLSVRSKINGGQYIELACLLHNDSPPQISTDSAVVISETGELLVKPKHELK